MEGEYSNGEDVEVEDAGEDIEIDTTARNDEAGETTESPFCSAPHVSLAS